MEPFTLQVLAISLVSLLCFQWLFHSGSPWLSARLCPRYANLRSMSSVEWNSRTVSSLHAVIVGLFCLYILQFDDAVNADPVWGDPTLVKINVAITTGYLASDMLLLCYYWRAIGDAYFIIHHLAALFACYYVLGEGMLPYFANFRLLAEFSTPCVNQRWFFEVLGYAKSSTPNMINGLAMTLTFFLVRVAVMPFYYSRMWAVIGSEAYYRVTPGGRAAWIGPSLCLDVMNLMWMHKMARGCLRVLKSIRQEPAGKQQNGRVELRKERRD